MAGVTVQLSRFLDAHSTKLWLQLPGDEAHWFPAAAARTRIPPAHLTADALVTKAPGLDSGSLWIEDLAVGYRWAMAHDRADPFRPHPWPWPPLEQRVAQAS
ncbi:MAG TPA: hypothetical protein VMU89_20470 [Thermomicrobiaceae bacterium]|nr:hypothetical protein [Thermomicrobiaceae bacterium]